MTNVFKASEIDSKRKGWIVDLSPSDAVNPDCYWFFSSKAKAKTFSKLVGEGGEPRLAERQAEELGKKK